ncbi:ChaN family lipoprotein [Haliea sp. E1-2-M8]|uniref:ChaN family lipoprotein n=1 Tax=Haliea sp. E1-2-M8 TaxID=3064706 RepID=UPI0027231108|nr:ChaN family lipoprotein [Haliea sp. E1-2-M8]MDO8862827.1 ChaN family lipoprotein [Haliea sp. E1-2-M8]
MTVLRHPITWLLLSYLLAGCVDTRQRTAAEPAAHPLLDQIWSTAAQGFIGMDELRHALANADYVLLGENHDNPAHHKLQAQIIASLAWPDPAVAGFEQIHTEQATALEAWLQSAPDGTSGLDTALDWEQSGWPDWALYEPVFAAVLARGWRPLDLMFPAATVRAVFSGGIDAALRSDVIEQLQPDALFSPEQRLEMQALMADSHCGRIPSEHMAAMVDVQIARDAHMAWRLATSDKRAVVITGNGHARRDWGVPLFLQQLRPEAKIVSITLTELAADRREPGAYATARPTWTDFTLFTAAQDRGDPCAGIP